MVTQPTLKMILGQHKAHVRAIYTPVSTCPDVCFLLQHPVCTHRRVVCLVRQETDLSHTPLAQYVCTHPWSRSEGQGQEHKFPTGHVASGKSVCSASVHSHVPSMWASCGAEGLSVCAHVYAQTVHTCASHEKMFISYMDIQTCMARKTPSLHVHRIGGGCHKVGTGAWALPSLCLTLSRLHSRPQFLLDNRRGWADAPQGRPCPP